MARHLSDEQLALRLEKNQIDRADLNEAIRRLRNRGPGGLKQTSSKLSKLAAQVMKDPKASQREKSLAGCVLSQDETPGNRE